MIPGTRLRLGCGEPLCSRWQRELEKLHRTRDGGRRRVARGSGKRDGRSE